MCWPQTTNEITQLEITAETLKADAIVAGYMITPPSVR